MLYKLITRRVQHTNVTVHFSLINCEFKNNQFLNIDSDKFNHHAFNNFKVSIHKYILESIKFLNILRRFIIMRMLIKKLSFLELSAEFELVLKH